MAFRVQRKKNVNVMRVGIKIGATVLALYVSGYFLTQVGAVMNGTCSPFYKGLQLIGWTIGTGATTGCVGDTNTITSTSGAGILSVVGIVAIALIVFEFVDIRF